MNIMFQNSEQYKFYDFSNCKNRGGQKMSKNEISLLTKDRAITFNQIVSKEAYDKGLMRLIVREDVLTDEIIIILNKEKGVNLCYTGVSKAEIMAAKRWGNLRAGNKALHNFLFEKLHLDKNTAKYIIKISDNLANSDDFMTFKIVK